MFSRIARILFTLLLTAVASTNAGTLVVTVDDPNLVPIEWVYIEVATYPWRPGCCYYDFLGCLLQGEGGFYATTFYSYYEPTYDDSSSSYNFETKCGIRRTFCEAKLDEFNTFLLKYNGQDGNTYEGSFRVIPRGDSETVDIKCSLVVGLLQCDDPVIAWDKEGTSTIRIAMNATIT